MRRYQFLLMSWAVLLLNGATVGFFAQHLSFLGWASLLFGGLAVIVTFLLRGGFLEQLFFGGMFVSAVAGLWLGYLVHHLRFV